ncbi:MAG TPA: Wzt carbohydrate-binding domain-containing protein, partial [Phycisphaerae bacterium]|nr:Wzt carbohydrate-binding domain-containing protein [Phycisphaerae bacterium]
SHNLTAVENLCPRTIWIDGGRIRQDGDSRKVIQSYLETFAEASSLQADLTEVETRKGSGEARFTRIEFLDRTGRPLDVIRSGEAVTIRLHYHVNRRVHEPHFGVEIYTNTGTLVTSINTWTTGYNLESLGPGPGHIEVNVGSLSLNPDRYYLSLWLASVGPKYYDQLELCLTLDVEAADVHNSGRSMAKYFGLVFLPCRWKHAGPGVGDNGSMHEDAGVGAGSGDLA